MIQPKARRVCFAGMPASPNSAWMRQIVRNLIDDEDGFFKDSRLLIMDQYTEFSAAFRRTLSLGGVHTLRLRPKTPNLNAHMERFFTSLKEECLDKMIFFGESLLDNAVNERVAHYRAERDHQGLGNQLIESPDEPLSTDDRVRRIRRDLPKCLSVDVDRLVPVPLSALGAWVEKASCFSRLKLALQRGRRPVHHVQVVVQRAY